MRVASCVGIGLCVVSSSWAFAQTPPPPPPAPAAPEAPVSLNNRTYIDTSDVYDPSYGLGRIGIVTDRLFAFSNVSVTKGGSLPTPVQVTRNFSVYDASFKAGTSGSVSIPVIGGVSLGKDEMTHVTMIDLVEATLPRSSTPATCEIWNIIKNQQIPPNTTVMYTEHAVLSKMTYVVASKQDANGKVGIGSYFSAGGDTYKDASSTTSIPMISVEGVKFVVKNPKTFCTPAGVKLDEQLTTFRSLSDLELTSVTLPKMLDLNAAIH